MTAVVVAGGRGEVPDDGRERVGQASDDEQRSLRRADRDHRQRGADTQPPHRGDEADLLVRRR